MQPSTFSWVYGPGSPSGGMATGGASTGFWPTPLPTYRVLLHSPLHQVVTLSSGVIQGITLASPVTLAIAAESPLQVTRVSPQ